ncbi:hypothetical protein [Methanospirillum lacunae]|uniref:Uncharacterized protein n=1 Tax=Methanospirillum lacunae TaxID=668570 RepID=A0A2V2MVD9_9EURY|nr:hypothetical protein [Methanospirillum lacunae]PWR72124.1 hypothetical protein DK846_09040 [Methanospirillum lacunae]
MKNGILICGLLLLSLCVLSVYAEPAFYDENMSDVPYEDMVTLPNGTTVNIVVFMPITVMINSDDDNPLHVVDRMNFGDTGAMLMGNGSFPEGALSDGFYKQLAGMNQTPVLNRTSLKHGTNTTVAPKISGNQSSAKPNLTITW